MVKNLPSNAGDVRDAGSTPGSGRFPGIRHGNPLQYSCPVTPVVKGVCWATVCGVTKSRTQQKCLNHCQHEQVVFLQSSKKHQTSQHIPDDGFDCKPDHGGEQEERGDEDVEERQRSKGLCRFEVVPAGIRMGHKRLCKERVLEKARESVTNTHVKFYKPNSCFYASRSTATLKNTFTSSKLLPKKNNTSVLKY